MPQNRLASSTSRRTFLKVSAAALATVPLPRRRRPSPNETLNVACVGVGGMGRADLGSVASGRDVRIAALCDVDARNLAAAAEDHAGARTFRDWRRLFDELEDDVDAVVVSTPDHMHAAIALAALDLGKHVYCQKPLAHDLRECRALQEHAARARVVTQMGIQIHAHEAYRTAVAALRKGVIGKVQAAHLWVGRSWAGPEAGRPEREDPVPEHLDWDLWLGVAPQRPFVANLYHPGQWRGWRDFGTGTLGDMGCHLFDPVFTALGLGAPVKVVSRGPGHRTETFAPDSDITYGFPATEWTAGEFTLRWTDGARRPDRKALGLPESAELPGAGSVLVGEDGVMVVPHWAMPRIYRGAELDADAVEPMAAVNHWHEWTDACRGEGETSTPFRYSGPLSEAVLVGTVAGAFPGRELRWDSARLRFDDADADALVERTYRDGWKPRL